MKWKWLAVCLCLAVLGGSAAPARAQEAYAAEEHEVFLNGQRIYGVLYVPREPRAEQMPAVIISHGFGGNHTAGASYAESLAGQGYVVYCFDFRGGSPGSRSDGSTLEMSIMTEADDLTAAMNDIRSLPYVQKDEIFLMGTSQGGVVSALVAARNPQTVRGLVLLYPAFVLVDTAALYVGGGDPGHLFPPVDDGGPCLL